MVRVVRWDGKNIPEELQDRPAGSCVLDSVEDDPEFSADEEDGLRTAFASLRAGRGRSLDKVRRTIDDTLAQ